MDCAPRQEKMRPLFFQNSFAKANVLMQHGVAFERRRGKTNRGLLPGNSFLGYAPMLAGPPAKHRLLLSLRSESAMGLRSVCGRMGTIAQPDRAIEDQSENESDFETAVDPEIPQVAVPRPEPQSDVPLFEAAALAPAAKRIERIELPLLSTEKKSAALALLNKTEVSGCTKCRLHETRTQTVFGEGDVDAKIFFIGEGPGETEDETGRPFVGRAGQLLDKMIGAMGLSRAQVFIANIVKCRPPENRVPAPDEVETCTPYLVRQLEIIRPKVIVTLGLPAVKYMLEDPKLTMGRTRGTWQSWRGIKLMPTYHPSYVLRQYTEANRQAVWSDLQMVMKEVGLPTKARSA
jgi:DNA polymerase